MKKLNKTYLILLVMCLFLCSCPFDEDDPMDPIVQEGPDLTVFDVYNNNGYLNIRIGNTGTHEAPQGVGTLRYFVDGAPRGMYILGNLTDQSYRSPGGETVILAASLSGEHHIKVEIDSDQEIIESNEGNNILEKTVEFRGPDLTVLDVYNNNGTLEIRIGNIGLFDVPPMVGKLIYRVDGVQTGEVTLGELADESFRTPDGKTTIHTVSLSGTHTINAEVDSDQEVTEPIENNNILEKEVVFGGLADLTVLDVYAENGNLKIKIGNIGTGKTSQAIGSLNYRVDGSSTGKYILANLTDQSFLLPGGETILLSKSLSGQHTIKAEIDPDNEIVELNEGNNVLEKIVDF